MAALNGKPITISIVVPVHQAAQTLLACVDSLLAQALSPHEIWLVENGSTDQTKALCEACERRDARIHFVSLEKVGVSRARNAGLQRSTGSHIAFVDADDTLPPQALKTLAREAGAYDWVLGSYCRVGDPTPTGHRGETPRALDAAQLAEYMLSHRMELLVGSVWGKLYRTDLAKQCAFPENISFAEDNLFNMAYATHIQRVLLLPDVVYYYAPQALSLASHIAPHWSAFSEIQEARLAYVRQYALRRGTARVYGCTLNMLLRALNEHAAAGERSEFFLLARRLRDDSALMEAVSSFDSESVLYGYAKLAAFLLQHGNIRLLYRLLHAWQRLKLQREEAIRT